MRGLRISIILTQFYVFISIGTITETYFLHPREIVKLVASEYTYICLSSFHKDSFILATY